MSDDRKCEVGGDCKGSLQAHHDDYAFPYDVRLLCRRHHSKWHFEHGPGLNRHLANAAHQKIAHRRNHVKAYLPDDLYNWIKDKAEREQRSPSQVINMALRSVKEATP